jgi:hypothetical protein
MQLIHIYYTWVISDGSESINPTQPGDTDPNKWFDVWVYENPMSLTTIMMRWGYE